MENKTSKYLNYAMGEIVLVVIGILIALQINNWNEYRKERIEENALYKTMIGTLEDDLQDVNSKIAIISKAIDAQKIFILNTYGDIINKYSSRSIDSLLEDLSRTSLSFFPNYGFYNKISNNGQIDFIESQELQLNIIKLYEQYYKRYNDLDVTLEKKVQFGLLDYFGKIVDSRIKNDGKFKTDDKDLERYYTELNDQCRLIYFTTESTREAMVDCRTEIEKLLAELRNALKESE